MGSFDRVVEAYAAGRPNYPAALFDALEPLDDQVVIEGGCGTGIASLVLVERGARLVAFDVGDAMAQHTSTAAPKLWAAIVADGARLPFRAGSADLLCFAQSWHWLDPERRIGEAARVLTSGGRLAIWWSHARADGQPWFDAYWTLVEDACVGTHRAQRDTDWGVELGASGHFAVREQLTFGWTRVVTVEQWLADENSKSYVAELPRTVRELLLTGVDAIVRREFASGVMSVPYETWLWIADATGQ